jgi:hypothetical protein
LLRLLGLASIILGCQPPAVRYLGANAGAGQQHLDGNNVGTFGDCIGSIGGCAMFFSFPEDARWNANRQTVEFSVGVGEYEGVVRVPRQVFQRFIDGTVTPERCLEAYHLHRTRFELIAERKLRNRQLTDDGNVEITGRDLRALRDTALVGHLSARRELEWPQARG